MAIIRVEILLKRDEIQNKMPLLLERVSPSSRILMNILEFHSKSKSRFGIQSSAYLLAQRLNVLELQINYLKCPYDVQTKISSYVQENGSTPGTQPASTTIQTIPMVFGKHGALQSSFLIDLQLMVLDYLQTHFLLKTNYESMGI